MAIYCPKCGKELPDDAQFCMKCGKPLGEAVQTAAQPEPTWEYCTVEIEEGGLMNWRYYAQAVGPRGSYRVPQSLKAGFMAGDKQQEATCNQLVNMLVADGWEPLPEHGNQWHQYKFRRKVR